MNDLSLEETNDRLREGVVIRIAAAADRRRDPLISQAIGVAHRQVLGGFNWWLQQLPKEKLQWVLRSGVDLIGQVAGLSVHQVGRRRDGVSIGRRSGRPSRAGYPAGTPLSTPAYHNRLARGGSARMA